MALKTITGKLSDSSTGLGGTVFITLSQPAVITGTQEIVNASVQPVVAADGTYSVQLQANNDLTPTGTYYTVEEIVGAAPYIFTIVVPQTAGPFVMSFIQTAPPTLGLTPSHVSTMTVDGLSTLSGSIIAGKDIRRSSQTVTEAALVAGIDAALGEQVSVTLTANRVVGLPVNPFTGQELQLVVTQGGAGNFRLTWPAGIKTTWRPAAAAGAISSLTLRYYGTSWQHVAGQIAVSDTGVAAHAGPMVVGSLTVQDPASVSPYAAVLPGDGTTPTPSGVEVGKLLDWGGATFMVDAAGSVGLAGAITAARDLGPVVLSGKSYALTGAGITYPANHRTKIIGMGQRLSTILAGDALGGSVMVDVTGFTHLNTEYFSSLENLTLDGGLAATGDLFSIAHSSIFRMRSVDVRQANGGRSLKFLSTWDTVGFDTHVESGTSGIPWAVFDTAGAEDQVQGRFFSFWVEGDSGAAPLVRLIGTSGIVRHNHFYYLKADGSVGNNGPTVSPLTLDANSKDNTFWGGDVAYGNGVPQITSSGDRNSFMGVEHINGSPATYAISIAANDSQIMGHKSTATYATGVIQIASGARNRIGIASYNTANAVFITDSGSQTDVSRGLVSGGFAYSTSITPDAQFIDTWAITVTDAVAFTINKPLNIISGHRYAFRILNSSGGAMGAITWISNYKMAGAFTNPANGKIRTIEFYYDGAQLYEISRAAADI